MWTVKNDYYMQRRESTICKVTLNGKLTYELWHMGKQYAGFTSADAAKAKYEELVRD